MKKLIAMLVFTMLLTILVPGITLASSQSVQVTLPTFKVTLNGIQVDSSQRVFPLLVYKDITYFPMTYYDCQHLGLQTNWNSLTGFDINNTGISGIYRDYRGSSTNNRSYAATLVNSPVHVNGTPIDNADEAYPMLLFRGIIYFPLTWKFAVDEFSWTYSFNSIDGLVINSTNPAVSRLNISIPSPQEGDSPVSIQFFVKDGLYYIRGDNNEINQGQIEYPDERSVVFRLPSTYWSHMNVYFYTRNNQVHLNYLPRIGGELNIEGTVRFNNDGSSVEITPYWEYFGDIAVMVELQNSPPTGNNLFIRQGDGEPVNVGDVGYLYGGDWNASKYTSGGSESRSLYLIDGDIYLLAYSIASDSNPMASINSKMGIYRVNISTNSTTRVIDANVKSFLIENDMIYYLDEADIRIYSVPLDGGVATPLTDNLRENVVINYLSDFQVLNGKVYYMTQSSEPGISGTSRYTLYRSGDPAPINATANVRSIQLLNGYIAVAFDSDDSSAYRMMVFGATGEIAYKTSDDVIPLTISMDNNRLYYIESESRLVGMVQLP
ncbi:MAG: DUF5050 domain-containing protein [Oscillospiraceae bacterium]|nr:DUF5050 domain-containing protein [Oscillospiraceae bacterium]